jgi:transcription elongation factor Elf1
VVAGFSISVHCTHCNSLVCIPHQPTKKLPWIAKCPGCGKQFGIESPAIARQVKLFVDLCQQIKASEEILTNAAIAVTVGSTEVKIPFRLLLTRLRTSLDLDVGGKRVSVSSRIEPLKMTETLATPVPSEL